MSIRRRLTEPLAGFLDRRGALEATFEQRRRLRRQRDRLVASARRWSLHPASTCLPASAPVAWVRRGSRWVLCRLEPRYRTNLAIERNFCAALDLVRAAGARHFFVPVESHDSLRLGVLSDDRESLIRSLVAADLPEESYVLFDGESTLRTQPFSHRRTLSGFREAATCAQRWTVVLPVSDPLGDEVLSDPYGCEIEFWERRSARRRGSGELEASLRNAVSPEIDLDQYDAGTIHVAGREIPTPTEFAATAHTKMAWFPVDAVYTWVDGSDPSWRARRAATLRGLDTVPLNEDATTSSRFENRDELRYSLRSLDQYADFVRHVYIVTDGQVPEWLDTNAPGLTVIDHADIFLETDRLPTFNSQAIEARLHRIPGLSAQYLYLNDDVFFGRRVGPELFFTRSGTTKYFESTAQIGTGPPTPDEPSITSAAKNGRNLLLREFSYFPTFKFKHTPHPQNRAILGEIERRFPEPYAAVGRHQFRSHLDISIASSLHHHVGHALGLSHPDEIAYDYFNLPSPNLPDRLERVRSLMLDTWCLNDGNVPPEEAASLDRMTADFLRRTLPWPSRFEK